MMRKLYLCWKPFLVEYNLLKNGWGNDIVFECPTNKSNLISTIASAVSMQKCKNKLLREINVLAAIATELTDT